MTVVLAAALAEIVGAVHVTPAARDVMSSGARTLLVRPGSAGEIAQIVTLAARHHALVVPMGTGTRRGVATTSERPRLVVDVKRLNNVLSLDETSLVVQVQAGITGLGLEELLLPRGLTIGDFPPAVLRSTLGGMLSVRTPGKSSSRHGLLEDAVLGLSAVLGSGHSIHTRVAPRRATGPDLARALLGSEGMLGIITGVVLRIHRRPEARLLDAHRLPSVPAAIAVVLAALRQDARPAALRVYDAGEARAHLGLELDDREAVLVAATAGAPELAAVDRDLLAGEAHARGATALGPAPAEVWWRRRFGHSVLGPAPPPPALEVAAAPTRLAPVHAAIVAAAREHGRVARAHIARFDQDGACLFVTLLDGSKPDPSGPARAAVEQAARAAGGQLVGAVDASFEPLLVALRRELDPHGVLGG